QTAKIRQLEQAEQDGFWKKLLAERPDFTGLPVLLGDACRMKKDLRLGFMEGARYIRESLVKYAANRDENLADERAKSFWTYYDDGSGTGGKTARGTPQAVSALMQIFAVETLPMRLGLTKYLAGLPHVEATQALAQLAVFAPEPAVR